MVAIDEYTQEKDCIYKQEHYSVRDNGAVLRHNFENKKPRPLDNNWIFGKLNERTGYLEIASVPIHRIVATAFHGEAPTSNHVVDHIDTNKHNNRPENLRWVTRLENILLNPITAKRISMVCGSVEAFLEKPSKYRNMFKDQSYSWMDRVSPDEAKTCLEHLLSWAKSDKKPSGGTLGDWIYGRGQRQRPIIIPQDPYSDLVQSLTNGAVQRKWKVPTEFPCCPKEVSLDLLSIYASNLKSGEVFSRNQYCKHSVVESVLYNNSIIVWSEDNAEFPIKPWAIAKITVEDDKYVHESISTFFTYEGAQKVFTIEQGLEWTGGDSIDDYC